VTVKSVPGRVKAIMRVTHRGQPVAGARVRLLDASGRTNRRGAVTLWPPVELPGRFKALARKGGSFGLSKFVEVER
jgi:hypothetical protein